jgi:hypothetical protein
MNREFFFRSALVLHESGSGHVRVRYRAEAGSPLRLVHNGETIPGTFQSNGNVTITVTNDEGLPSVSSIDEESDLDYSPWIEFLFVGKVTMEKAEVDGESGLLVSCPGALHILDIEKNLPFTESMMQAASRLELIAYDDESDCGPHFPKKEV